MTEEGDDAERTMRAVDHTHPHTDAPFGESGVYDRGPGEDSEAVDDQDADTDGSDDDGGRKRAAVERVDADGDPVRTDGGADVPSQPAWAVHDVSDDDR